jgi:hypothetical protein
MVALGVDMRTLILAVLACLAPLLARAEGWEYAVAPYAWLPAISLDSSRTRDSSGLVDGSRLDVEPSNYLKALDFALMLAADMRKDDWVVQGDLIYLKFGTDDRGVDFLRPDTGPIAGDYRAGLEGAIIALAGGRTLVRTANYYFDGLVGMRRVAMSLDVTGDLDSGGSIDLESDIDVHDAYVAGSGRYAFGEGDRWSLRYYADLGTGESDLTWQASLGLGYGFGWGDLFVNYRHLEYDFGDVRRFDDLKASFSGPSIGGIFHF